ncbi:hypothetical protein EVAR_78498_1 [Eumeta japonica]|uniref:Uncharacterized protein n=1 Tax=Eumeta variegata TaxID=151549 RepID=A0A4C1TYA2_EUMVA|nr:hypothetical protein EVAR_78498_1 [Eumeta japonica]
MPKIVQVFTQALALDRGFGCFVFWIVPVPNSLPSRARSGHRSAFECTMRAADRLIYFTLYTTAIRPMVFVPHTVNCTAVVALYAAVDRPRAGQVAWESAVLE